MLRSTSLSASAVATLLLFGGSRLPAQTGDAKPKTNGPQKVSMQQYKAHLASVQTLLHDCAASAPACDRAKVGDDERVDDTPSFDVHWRWLRDTLDQARKADPQLRTQLMKESTARLDEMQRDNAQPASQAGFSNARSKANAILATPEFSIVHEESWLDRLRARVGRWLGTFFTGLGVLDSAGPWLGRLIEIVLFGGAATVLIFFLYKSVQRQRLAVEFNADSAGLAWKRDSTDWAADAEDSARNGNWRDAVHCLYWATIVMLEGRRAWRHNPARTPREYVRLLKPGSSQQRNLRGLTQIFERLWYGLRDAGPADYDRARSLYEDLRDNAASPEAAS